jgi:hypothetical protein
MAATAELWCVALLIAMAVLAIVPAVRASPRRLRRSARHHRDRLLRRAVRNGGAVERDSAALGLSFIGARFRVDPLSAFFPAGGRFRRSRGLSLRHRL